MERQVQIEKEEVGNGQNTVSRVLFQKRELAEFCVKVKLSEFFVKLSEFALACKFPPDLDEGQTTY